MSAKSLQSCLTLYYPMDCSPPGSSVHGDSPGKNTEVGCHSLHQGIFPTQGSNLCLLCLLNWQADSLPLVPPGKSIHTHTHTHKTIILLYIWNDTILPINYISNTHTHTHTQSRPPPISNSHKPHVYYSLLKGGARSPHLGGNKSGSMALEHPLVRKLYVFKDQQPCK